MGCVLACTALGCGSDNLLPVTGTVSFDNRPLAAGSVVFHPDASKGNTSQHLAAGEVKDGKYELWTNRQQGAPPGAYKVVLIADNFSGPDAPKKGATAEMPKSLLPARYADKEKTPLSVVVTSSPAAGAYDLKVTGK